MKTANIPYIEKLADGGLLFHGFDNLRMKGRAILRTAFNKLLIDSDISGYIGKPGALLFRIDRNGMVNEPLVNEIIRQACPDLKTAFVPVNYDQHPVFYVKSPCAPLPDTYGDENDDE